MGVVNVSVGGFTPWRDRPDPYDYSKLTDKQAEAAVYIITNPPAAWNFSADAWKLYEEIYGTDAKVKAQKTAMVAENTDATWIYGTQANTLEKALALKAAGKIFGYDQRVVPPEDHTGMIYIKTLFGETWVPADNYKFYQLSAKDALDNIRAIVREEIQGAFPENF